MAVYEMNRLNLGIGPCFIASHAEYAAIVRRWDKVKRAGKTRRCANRRSVEADTLQILRIQCKQDCDVRAGGMPHDVYMTRITTDITGMVMYPADCESSIVNKCRKR